MIAGLLLAAAVLPADYRNAASWLCRPGRVDACAADLTRTVVAPDGRTRIERVARATAPKADCFYVYPTVSLDAAPNSDLTPGPEERATVVAQLGPLAGVCRLFAPMYRQVSLAGLHAVMAGKADAADRELPYADVRAAWHDYLAHDNRGRPVVLVGHSQGSLILKRLIAAEVDDTAVAARLLSAILPGTTVLVPPGADVGGDFRMLPLCRRDGQTGCILTWASYRDTAPPSATALFGRASGALVAGCTNPARLAGGAAPLDAVLGRPWFVGGVAQYRAPAAWTAAGTPLATDFVRVPGLLTGECVTRGAFTYLGVHVTPGAAADLATEVTGAATVGDGQWPDWGWHVIDSGIVAGDVARVVAAQIAAWRR